MNVRDLPTEIKCIIISFSTLPWTMRALLRSDEDYLRRLIHTHEVPLIINQPNRPELYRLLSIPTLSIWKTINPNVVSFSLTDRIDVILDLFDVISSSCLDLTSHTIYSGCFEVDYDIVTELNLLARCNLHYPPKPNNDRPSFQVKDGKHRALFLIESNTPIAEEVVAYLFRSRASSSHELTNSDAWTQNPKHRSKFASSVELTRALSVTMYDMVEQRNRHTGETMYHVVTIPDTQPNSVSDDESKEQLIVKLNRLASSRHPLTLPIYTDSYASHNGYWECYVDIR